MKTDKLPYSRCEAAKLLGVCLPSLDALVRRGELHPVRIGARVMFSPAELLRFAGVTA